MATGHPISFRAIADWIPPAITAWYWYECDTVFGSCDQIGV